MTDYKITPPPELVHEWDVSWRKTKHAHENYSDYIATQAAQWGADQELEACCMWLSREVCDGWGLRQQLRSVRRPKSPSLSKPALAVLDDASDRLDAAHENTIRRALERLQELEGND